MKLFLIVFCFALLPLTLEAQLPDHINKDYSLTWFDEFSGEEINSDKWDYRATGSFRNKAWVSEKNCFLNSEGQLCIQTTKEGDKYYIGQIGTQNKYLTKYGYFECRAKMNSEKGPHVAFWLQSPNLNEQGTEIDIFEYHINEGRNWVYHNLHWDGYGEDHKQAGTKIHSPGLESGYHTFGLEWTADEYIFYVDGNETWRSKEAVSDIPEYIILSAELTGWGGDFSQSNFPDTVTFDYVRVYKKKAAIEQFELAKNEYLTNPNDPNKLIWYGRRMAYTGDYDQAIKIYSQGVDEFPEDARFLRHRGHRYISMRQYDKAIEDFMKASILIKGTKNQIEPDGIPNAAGIPISTLHGNIWYHLGLAYYLKHDYARAYEAYLMCRKSGDNYDNIVSSTNWLYMIQQRLENPDLAEKMLDPIIREEKVIENQNYYDLCLFYKGIIPLSAIQKQMEDNPAADAIKYGIANWNFSKGNKEKAKQLWLEMTDGEPKASFGYLAAESDLKHYFNINKSIHQNSREMNGQFSHVVYFWLNEPDNQKARDQFEKAITLLVESSAYAHTYHLGKSVASDRPVVDDTFTYSLIINFASKADHDTYQVEPAHLKFVEENQDLWDRVVVYDSTKF